MPSSTNDLLATLPISDRAKSDLIALLSGPDRHYHTMDHLGLLWERHRRFADGSPINLEPFAKQIALAIAFHDSVYVGGAKDNETRSAELWLKIDADVAKTDRLWVADTIRATADHLTEGERLDLADEAHYARQWMLDLDLTPLGEAPNVFDDNMTLLKAEDPNVDLVGGIRHYASAKKIYRCAPLAGEFEEAARANFMRHLRHDGEERGRKSV